MKSTAKTVGFVMIIMVCSRLLALVSNQVYITYFGINTEMDIFAYATQLPNIIFNSLGTALATVVIPIFAGYIGTGEKERAYKFADNVLGLSTVFTIILSLLAILASPLIIMLTRFRYEGYNFAVVALQVMFPVMIFYALNYIFQGVLQSLGKYNMPAFVSVPSSLIVILYVLTLGSRYGVKGLLIATFIGLSTQALILVPPVLKTEYRIRLSFDYRSEDIRNALKLIAPVLIGTSAYQMNLLFNTTLSANFKDTVALMVTVQNLVLYAILAFIYSITAVIFPKLTMLAARNDMAGFKDNLSKVLRSVIFFLVPATAGFIAVRVPLVDLLYGWGKITGENITLAGSLLAFYAAGITGVGIKEVVDRAFYSLKDTKRPAFNGIAVMVINILLSLFLVYAAGLGVFGIPMAYSASALAGSAILLFMMRKKIGDYGEKRLLSVFFKIAACGCLMYLALIPVNLLLKANTFGPGIVDKSIKLFIPCIAGALVYAVLTCLFRVEEAVMILTRVKARVGLK